MENEKRLSAGFARVDITPPLGIPMGGYYDPQNRLAKNVKDPLEISALAVSDGERTAILFSADLLMMNKMLTEKIRRRVEKETGVSYEALFIACTHTHTGPNLYPGVFTGELAVKVEKYLEFLEDRFCDAAILALTDRKPALMGYAVSELKDIAFIRRFRMKNGTVRTNPGRFDPEIIEPAGKVDEQVNVLRFIREGGKEIIIGNFGVHACCMKGIHEFSADFPRFTRQTIEAALPAHCIFFSGAEGDVNHYNPFWAPKNENPFEQAHNLSDAGYNFSDQNNAAYIGRAIAGSMLQVYGNMTWADDPQVAFGEMQCTAFFNKPEPEEIPWAEELLARKAAGENVKETYPPHSLARAQRILRHQNSPETDELPVSAVRIGPAAFVGFPGEPFTKVGVDLKEQSPFDITLPCCCTNGAQGYYPMQEDYAGNSYEAISSNFKAGTAEKLVTTGTELLHKLNG